MWPRWLHKKTRMRYSGCWYTIFTGKYAEPGETRGTHSPGVIVLILQPDCYYPSSPSSSSSSSSSIDVDARTCIEWKRRKGERAEIGGTKGENRERHRSKRTTSITRMYRWSRTIQGVPLNGIQRPLASLFKRQASSC